MYIRTMYVSLFEIHFIFSFRILNQVLESTLNKNVTKTVKEWNYMYVLTKKLITIKFYAFGGIDNYLF